MVYPVQYKKLERDSAIALHSIVENHSIDFDNVQILQRGFTSHKARLIAESLAIARDPTCINRSDGADISTIWLTASNYIRQRTRVLKKPSPNN